MRIRKNAKISQLSSISSTPSSSSTSISNPLLPKTHQYLQCQLNQSPWDIITFPIPPPQEDSSSPHFQVEDLGFAGNGSSGDSIGAIQSTRSMKLACTESEEKLSNDVKWDFCEVDNGVGINKEVKEEEVVAEEEDVVLCSATDGKGWQCGRVVKKGHQMCGRHWKKDIVMMGDKKSDMSTTLAARRGRGRPRIKKKEAALAKNPYEFCYYSGFGVRKKASGRTMDSASGIVDLGTSTISKDEDTARTGLLVKCGSGIFEDEEIGYMECDDEDDYDDIEEEEKSGKKRGRKRIKARSLKSLM